MARLRAGRTRPGILALFEAANRNFRDAVTSDLAFAIAPRLNAAGRLTDMTVGIHCLLEENTDTARKIARDLSELNLKRRELQSEMQSEAEAQVERLPMEEADSLCLYDPGWHQGIVGLVATRVRERIHRPVIAFAPGEEEGFLKGSGRSVPGVHLRDMLAAVDAKYPELIERYGGHAMAAGLTLMTDRLQEFREAFGAEVERHAHQIAAVDELWSDGELGPDDLGLELAEVLRHAAPWGQAFPEPAFDGLFEVADQRIVGESHLKLRLQPAGTTRTIDAIAFNLGDRYPLDEKRTVRALYRLDVNEFRARRSPQLVVEYLEYE
jgi:single-stranded-DNA-specific exonuclease